MSARIEYAPGEAWCIAVGRVVLVCERDLPAVRARALHDAAGVVDSVEALRTVLELEPAALLGAVDLDEGRVLLRRHGVPATADDEPLADRFGASWEVDEVPREATIAAGALAALTVDTLPLGDGVVRVAAVRVEPRPADDEPDAPAVSGEAPSLDVDAAEPASRTGAFGETLPPRRSPEPPVAEADVEAVAPEAVAPEAVVPEPVAPVAEPEPTAAIAPEPAAPAAAPAPAAAVAAPLPPAAPAAQPAQNPIGGLIDSVPGFIRPAVDVRAVEPAAAPAPAAAPSDAAPVAAAPSDPAPSAAAPSAAAQPAEGPIAEGDAGDHDGMTITAEQARKLQEERSRAADAQAGADAHAAAMASASAPATGPLVLSTLCPRGHVNAPGTLACMQCGEPVDDGSAAQRRRPEVAVAVLPSGERVPLGRGVVLGRRPRSRRAEDGRVPRLVTVESPGEDISRSHLELRVEDWNLVGIDLSSTNGTLLLREGAAPQRLRPEASTILQLGDRLDMGDGVVVTIEPATGEPAP